MPSPATRPAAPRAASLLPFCSACVSVALPGALSPAGALGGPPRAPTLTLSRPHRATGLTEAHLLAPSPCQSRAPPCASTQAVPGWPLGTPHAHPAPRITSPRLHRPHSPCGAPTPCCVAQHSPSLVQRGGPRLAGSGARRSVPEGREGLWLHGPRGPAPQRLSPHLPGSEPRSGFSVAGRPQPLPPSTSPTPESGGCPETPAGLHCPSASLALIPLSLKTASDLPPRLLRLWVALPRPCQGRLGRRSASTLACYSSAAWSAGRCGLFRGRGGEPSSWRPAGEARSRLRAAALPPHVW